MANKAYIIGINTLELQYCNCDADLMSECLGKYGYEIIKPRSIKSEINTQLDIMVDTCQKTDTTILYLTVRPFLRRFRRNSTQPCIESQREAKYLKKTLLEWAQSGDVSLGLLAPCDDDGQGETLKRFEQAFGRRASRFAPGIPGLTSCQLCSLSRSLTAAYTCQERQPPQGNRYQPEAPCGLVVSLQRHRCAGEGPPCEPPQAPLHLIGTARGQHRVRQ